jgi:hypothetical protein
VFDMRTDHGANQVELARRHPIGDRRSGALVSATGTIDWWAQHRLDADATLYQLVHPTGARVAIQLDGLIHSRCTRALTFGPVVRTTLHGLDAIVTIDDHIAHRTVNSTAFEPGTLVRLITVVTGSAHLMLNVVPGDAFDAPRRTYRGSDGVAWTTTSRGSSSGAQTSSATVVRGMATDTPVVLHAGQHLMVTLSHNGRDQRVRREAYDRSLERLDYDWRRLSDVAYDGTMSKELRGWMRQLWLLTNIDTGAVVRSFSTSLPQRVDGDRQLDERLAYLDDNARFVQLAERLQRHDVLGDTRAWLADALRRGSNQARSLDGENPPDETELSLTGWRQHQPVRRSDLGAHGVDLAALANASLTLDAHQHRDVITTVAHRLDHQFRAPNNERLFVDGGRWAGRTTQTNGRSTNKSTNKSTGAGSDFVSSAIAVRHALLAASATERRHDPLSTDAGQWSDTAKLISGWLRTEGCFSVESTAGWRRTSHDNSSDAQLLRWIAPADPTRSFPDLTEDDEHEARIRSSLAISQTMAQLDDGGLMHRHLPHIDDGFAPGQSADVSASADLVTALCRLGDWDSAHQRMELLVSLINGSDDDIGTVPAQLDPRTGAHRGNRPYAPALLSLCEAAMALSTGPK